MITYGRQSDTRRHNKTRLQDLEQRLRKGTRMMSCRGLEGMEERGKPMVEEMRTYIQTRPERHLGKLVALGQPP